MKTFQFLLRLRTRENTDVLLHSMTIFMVFTAKKENILSIYVYATSMSLYKRHVFAG